MEVRQFTLPDLGEGLQEAEVVEWHVMVGDRVVADQPLLSVETDKAVVEVPAPWAGTVTDLLANPGDLLAVGAPLAVIEDTERSDPGAIVGRLQASEPEAPAPPAPKKPARAPNGLRAAPAARALAREVGIDLADISGTGPGGAITRADVQAAASGPRPGSSATRNAMARTMARAHAEVVPATVNDVADVTGWFHPEADVMVRLVRAICIAVKKEPALNSWYDPENRYGPPPEGVALGIAVDTPNGLYVPVLPGAETFDTAGVRDWLDATIADIHARRASSGAATTPTISLSNFGPLGGRHASLVVVPPQVAILGAGRAYETVGWEKEVPTRAVALPLSLTFDHRAVTGGEAARFLQMVRVDLEKPG